MEAYTFVTASQANKRKQTKREVRGSKNVDFSSELIVLVDSKAIYPRVFSRVSLGWRIS
jgi:hypothetical protein